MRKFDVSGMTCAACSARVEKAVSALEGVEECSVNLLTNSMNVEGSVTDEAILEAVSKAGYSASRSGGGEKKKSIDDIAVKEYKHIRTRLICSLVFLAVLMYITMGHMMLSLPLPSALESSAGAMALLQLLITAVIMVINQKFFINGFKSIMHGAPNMDSLVALGAASAFLYSVAVMFNMLISNAGHMHDLYFESAAMILTLITLGKLLEARAKGKTTDAVKSLMNLAPQTAVLIRDGKEVVVSIENVMIGDVFVVKSGDTIPVDGKIIEGSGSIDESALTGESIPVDKAEGQAVFAATINQSGYMKCEAVKVGEDTTLAQIIKVVNDAASTKAPIGQIADKVSGIFVPTVIGIALLTLAVWMLLGRSFSFSLARAISVLVVSCPCALGLATPVAIMVGSGVGAKNGILFKTATALELTGRARIIALDKTGTITEGKPKVTDVVPYGTDNSGELLTLAASIEKYSEHPLAKAVSDYAEEKHLTLTAASNFKVYPGNGVSAEIGGDTICGGNLEFVKDRADIPNALTERAAKLASSGKTPLYFCKNNSVLGIIAVADTIKEDGVWAISNLKKLGLRVAMITGDNERTARAIGDFAGIDEIYHDVMPERKEEIVRELQGGGRVIMVGDGINDAPALTRADVGVAIGTGTDIAIDAADVVLVRGSLGEVVSAIKLSRAAIKNIYENLFWAFSYNIIGIPLAAGVFISWLGFEMSPMFGAAAMSVSSFLVVSNALRLNFVRLGNNKAEKSIKENIVKEEKTMDKVIGVEGMMCAHCEGRVKAALEKMTGVSEAYVSHEKKLAEIKTDGSVKDEDIKAVIEGEGYTVTSIEDK